MATNVCRTCKKEEGTGDPRVLVTCSHQCHRVRHAWLRLPSDDKRTLIEFYKDWEKSGKPRV